MRIRTVRFEADKHYAFICEWWSAHNWPAIPIASLPQVGIIIYINDVPIAAAWLYRTDSNLGWMEWMISNPQAEKPIRNLAITELIYRCIATAKEIGIGIIFTSIRVPRLIRRLEEAGFTVNDTGMTNLTKVVL